MSSSVLRSWKTRSLAAIITFSAQEYNTSSTANNHGDRCEKQERGCENSITCSVKYSSVGSTAAGDEQSVMILGGRQSAI